MACVGEPGLSSTSPFRSVTVNYPLISRPLIASDRAWPRTTSRRTRSRGPISDPLCDRPSMRLPQMPTPIHPPFYSSIQFLNLFFFLDWKFYRFLEFDFNFFFGIVRLISFSSFHINISLRLLDTIDSSLLHPYTTLYTKTFFFITNMDTVVTDTVV